MQMISNIPRKVIAVVPAFNEAETIEKVVRTLLGRVDVVVVDDCSTDDTSARASQAGALVHSNETNLGYDGAINVGFKKAVDMGAEIIATFDADGQHDIADLDTLISMISNGEADVAVGTRNERSSFGEKLFSLYTNYRFGIKDPLCGLKAYRAEIYKKLGRFDTLQSIGTQLLLESKMLGYTIAYVPIQIHGRADTSRFYARRIRGNIKIIKALVRVIVHSEIRFKKKKYEKR